MNAITSTYRAFVEQRAERLNKKHQAQIARIEQERLADETLLDVGFGHAKLLADLDSAKSDETFLNRIVDEAARDISIPLVATSLVGGDHAQVLQRASEQMARVDAFKARLPEIKREIHLQTVAAAEKRLAEFTRQHANEIKKLPKLRKIVPAPAVSLPLPENVADVAPELTRRLFGLKLGQRLPPDDANFYGRPGVTDDSADDWV